MCKYKSRIIERVATICIYIIEGVTRHSHRWRCLLHHHPNLGCIDSYSISRQQLTAASMCECSVVDLSERTDRRRMVARAKGRAPRGSCRSCGHPSAPTGCGGRAPSTCSAQWQTRLQQAKPPLPIPIGSPAKGLLLATTAATDSTFASAYRHKGLSREQSSYVPTSPLVPTKVVCLNSGNQG